MKTTLLLTAEILLSLLNPLARADIIAQWDFNSVPPDGTTSTGTNRPAAGNGTASPLGGISGSYSAGSSSDPAPSSDNSGWNTDHYPGAISNNLTAGVRFDVSTLGYQNISVSWAERHSTTASRYLRAQYTLDGNTFSNAGLIALYADSVFTNQAVNLGSIPGVANNPNFGFRLVSEFESSATGSGTNAYVATKSGSSYSTGGTIRFDMVTVSGYLIPGSNSPPTISGVSDQSLRENQSTPALPFLILDNEDPESNLTLSKDSSNPAVVPVGNIVFGGASANRTVTVTSANQPGVSTITIYVTDTGGKSNSTSFVVTVLPPNTPPTITSIPLVSSLINTSTAAIPFTIWDLETAPTRLSLSGGSANAALVPNNPANIVFGGSGSNRTLTLIPSAGQSGVAPITVIVSDGTNTASTTFPLMVTPSAAVVLCDPFGYPTGSLLTNSAFLWNNRSGTFGECRATNGQLLVTSAQTEDVTAALVDAPYTKGGNTVLYAGFKANFLSVSKATAGYFAHFGSSSASLRGRIYAGTNNAAPGSFRLSVANGIDTGAVQLATDLTPNTNYTIVVRYNLDTTNATLWVNPTAESDPGVTASDTPSAASISGYGFRQDADIGTTVLIDDLKVGLSFASVLPSATVEPIPLAVERSGSNVILRWSDSAFALQAAPAPTGAYTNIPGAFSPYTNSSLGPARFFRLKLN